jgi:hypothetical protein
MHGQASKGFNFRVRCRLSVAPWSHCPKFHPEQFAPDGNLACEVVDGFPEQFLPAKGGSFSWP